MKNEEEQVLFFFFFSFFFLFSFDLRASFHLSLHLYKLLSFFCALPLVVYIDVICSLSSLSPIILLFFFRICGRRPHARYEAALLGGRRCVWRGHAVERRNLVLHFIPSALAIPFRSYGSGNLLVRLHLLGEGRGDEARLKSQRAPFSSSSNSVKLIQLVLLQPKFTSYWRILKGVPG